MKENHSSSEHEHSYDNHHSHEDHHDHSHHVADYWKRFIISLIISIPIFVLLPLVQELLGFELTLSGDRYVVASHATFIVFYGGYPFLQGLYEEVKDRAIGMMTLIGIAITVS